MKKFITFLVLLLTTIGYAQTPTGIKKIVITNPAAIEINAYIPTNATGFGLADGKLYITATGRVEPYTYSWFKNSSSFTPTKDTNNPNTWINFSAGNYTVIASNDGCSSAPIPFTIFEPAELLISLIEPNIIGCFGGTTTLAINNNTATGGYPYVGTKNYTYSWYKCDNSNGSNASSISDARTNPVTVGFYYVEVNDGKNKKKSNVVQVTQNEKITVSENKIEPLCNGNNGSVTLAISGGKGNYNVAWTGAALITNNGKNLSGKAGTYNYTITDADVPGCSITGSVTFTDPAPLMINSITQTQPSSSTASDGTITVNVSGGSGTYSYFLKKDNGATIKYSTNLITGLQNGSYEIFVRDSNQCTSDTRNVKLEALTINLVQQENVKCYGENTGSITIKASGGTLSSSTNYTYKWYKNGVEFGGNTPSISGLGIGNYYVTVSDNLITIPSQSFDISQPIANLQVSIADKKDISCPGADNGAITLNVTGGSGGYTYSWIDLATTKDRVNLSAGLYTVTVRDANGCEFKVENIEIKPAISITIPQPTISPVSIYGQKTGAINFTSIPTGGFGTHTYSWTSTKLANPVNSLNLANLEAGIYTLEVKDFNECISSKPFTVTQNPELIVKIKETAFIKCFGGTNGQLTAEVTGGVAPYTYVWKKGNALIVGENQSTITNLGKGMYSVYITDSANPGGPYAQANQLNYDLKEPNELKVAVINSTNVLCHNATTGAISIAVEGGNAPYTYKWTKNGADYSTTKDLINLGAGTYQVVVTDAVGHNCIATLKDEVVISQPNEPLQIKEVSKTNLTGFETNNGSIIITVIGGTPNYTYEWTKDADPTIIGTTASITNLSKGMYHLLVKDKNSCSLPQADYEITQPDKLEIVLTPTPNTELKCFGATTAEYKALITGGVKEYTLEWLNTTTGQKYSSIETITSLNTVSVASNLAYGDYVVTVKDAKNNILFGTNTFTIKQPDVLAFTYESTPVSCFGGADGSIQLIITGGTKSTDPNNPFTITSGGGTIDPKNGIISGLAKGSYIVQVTDANGCQTAQQTIEISAPEKALFIANEVSTPTTGFGLATGKIEISVGGGTSTYSYVWKNSNGTTIGTNSPMLSNIAAGEYSVVITDAKGCDLPKTFTVLQPTKPIVSETHLQAKCNGLTGSLEASAAGGATFAQSQSEKIYIYTLKNKTTGVTQSITGNTATFTTIADGDYELTATDVAGIVSNTIPVVFKQPSPIVVSLTSTTNVSCFGGQDGAIEIAVVGGSPSLINSVPSYTYQWQKKNATTNSYENFTPTSLTTLKEGIYAVIVRDANYDPNNTNYCVGLLENIVITQPEDFGFDIDKINYSNPTAANGNDGTLHFEIKGGKKNYDYQLFTKNTLGAITIVKTISNSASKMVDFTGLKKDHYYASVKDDTGCTKYTDFDFTDNPLTSSITQTQVVSCFEANDGELQATVNGGFGTKTISWYRDGILLDNEHGTSLMNVKKGTYYAVVKDSKMVEVTSNTINVTQPNLVTFSTTQEPVKCLGDSNGSTTLSALGGNGLYRYRYFFKTNLVQDWTAFSNGSRTTIADLAAGDYTVQVQDTKACQSTDASITISAPTALIISGTKSVPTSGFGLANGSSSVEASGGNGNYTYQWFQNGSTTPIANTATANNLAAGKYFVLITDAKNCTLTSPQIEVTEPALLVTSAVVQNIILCNGDSNGSLRPITTGGFLKPGENYTYQWFADGNATPLATSAILSNIGKGSYYVIATDSNGNKATSKSIILTQPEILNNTLSAEYTLCGDANDWTITTAPTGGTPTYNYSWNTGAKTSSLQNVPPGKYSVVITDKNGCDITKEITIIAPLHLAATAQIKKPTCYGGADATIALTTIGGKAPYTSLWSTGEKSSQLSNAKAGDNSVTITDAKGCIITEQYTIENPPKDVITLGEDVTLCIDQTLTINATINDDKASYFWQSDKGFTNNKPIVTLKEPANYTLTITNKLGCQASDTMIISSQNTPISAEFVLSSQVFTNEVFTIIDISNPRPDGIEWILPTEAIVKTKNKNLAEISFPKTGEYEISMTSKKGNCTAYQTKKVLVVNGEYKDPDSTDAIKNFDLKIYPNPSNGIFTVDVTLDQVMPATIKIFSLINNSIIASKSENGKQAYLFDFGLSGLAPGVYFVLFESQQGSKLRKIIIL